MKKILSLLVFGLGLTISAIAQDAAPAEKTAAKPKYTKNTFSGTKIINFQSTEMVGKGYLQFMISHHFGNLWNKDASTGQNFAQMLGLNSGIAHTYLSFDFTPTKFLNVGLAATGSARFEGWAKFKILRQQTGVKNIPVSVAWVSLFNVDANTKAPDELTWNKFSYLHQLLIAHKFSEKFSLQLSPTVVHYNEVPYGKNNTNNIFSMGIAGKYKMTPKRNLTFEYSRQFNMYENVLDKNGNVLNYQPDLLSLGLEFNTSGHVFQFYLGTTTAASTIEQLTRNTNSLKKMQFALGFTLNRALSLAKQ